MSTLTMTDSYDTQMMDYSGDIDMQVPGSSESWFHDAPMVEDGIMDDLTEVDGSVEVDMEADAGESAEFEMIDDVEHVAAPEGGLVDVEVYDLSRVHSPAVIAPDPPNEFAQHATQEHFGMSTETPISLAESLHDVQETQITEGLYSLQQDVEATSRSPAAHTPGSALDVSQEEPDSAIVHPEILAANGLPNAAASSPVVSEGRVRVEDTSGQDAAEGGSAMATGDLSPVDGGSSSPEAIQLGEHEAAESAASTTGPIPQSTFLGEAEYPTRPSDAPDPPESYSDTLVEQDEGVGPISSDNLQEDTADTTSGDQVTPAVNPQGVEATPTDPSNGALPPDADNSSSEGLATLGGCETREGQDDPHRISEGVYIDPPPAVLLTLSTVSTPSEYCLFNQPSSSSSPVETHGNANPNYPLFLHQRPVLYYEPLRDVFDALRREEVFTSVAGAASGELCLDAYDLQLVVFEDNMFAREISLHDLNVLHDGFGLPGPLRLRLSFTTSRFITRYQELREQLGRLALTGPPEGRNEDDIQPTTSHDDVEGAQDTESVDALDHEAGTTQDELCSINRDNQGPEIPDDQYPEESVEDRVIVEGDVAAEENYANEVDGTLISDRPQAVKEGDEDEQTDSVSSTTLDADGVHDASDAEGGGEVDDDYTNYKEYAEAEEDTEEFGEVLPEEFEGIGGADDELPSEYCTLSQNEADIPLEESEVIGPSFALDLSAGHEEEGEGEVLDSPEQPTNVSNGSEQENYDTVDHGQGTSELHEVSVDPSEEQAEDEPNETYVFARDTYQGPELSEYPEEHLDNDDEGEAAIYERDQEQWDEELSDTDATWDVDTDAGLVEETRVASHKSSKRSFDEFEEDDAPDGKEASLAPSPECKRIRKD